MPVIRMTKTKPAKTRVVLRNGRLIVMAHKFTKNQIKRRYVLRRDGFRCHYCGSQGKLTLDHVVPRSKGGGNSLGNLVACCPECNGKKADLDPEQWWDKVMYSSQDVVV